MFFANVKCQVSVLTICTFSMGWSYVQPAEDNQKK
jgi:hypothetical protein